MSFILLASVFPSKLATIATSSTILLALLVASFAFIIFLIIQNRKISQSVNESHDSLAKQSELITQLEKENSLPSSEHRNKITFLSNMSHEIRTPMNAILGFTQLLQQKTNDPESLEYLSSISQSGDLLIKLINDILDLSKIESGNFQIRAIPTDLQRVCDEIVHIFSPKISRKGLKLQMEISPNLPNSLLIDESRVRQILFNLVSNAIKHTHAGRVSLKLFNAPYQALANSHKIIFEVTDTGVGIGTELLSEIFATSGRKGPTRKAGLRLPLSKSLAEAMNGTLTVKSNLDQGSTFTLTLNEVKTDSGSADKNTKKTSPFSLNSIPPTILIADDIKLNRELARKFLAPLKPRLLEATNGSEAIDLAKAYSPDLILMDIKMPVMDGYEASRRLQQESATRAIPIVAICASIDGLEKGVDNNISDVLLKPVTQLEVLKVVRKHLPQHFEGEGLQSNFSEEDLKFEVKEIKELEELQHKLASLQEDCENLKPSKSINEIEHFAEQIKALATTHNCIKLYTWGEALEINAASFEVEKLTIGLEKFPSMVQQLQNTLPTPN